MRLTGRGDCAWCTRAHNECFQAFSVFRHAAANTSTLGADGILARFSVLQLK